MFSAFTRSRVGLSWIFVPFQRVKNRKSLCGHRRIKILFRYFADRSQFWFPNFFVLLSVLNVFLWFCVVPYCSFSVVYHPLSSLIVVELLLRPSEPFVLGNYVTYTSHLRQYLICWIVFTSWWIKSFIVWKSNECCLK